MARGDYLREVLESGQCPKCHEKKEDIDERYSFGVYAGVMCVDCAKSSFRDQCGLGGEEQGDPGDLDEEYEPDDPSDLLDYEEDW